MKTFDWCMAWTLVLFILDAVGIKEYPTWLIIAPVWGMFMLGLLVMIIQGVSNGYNKNRK